MHFTFSFFILIQIYTYNDVSNAGMPDQTVTVLCLKENFGFIKNKHTYNPAAAAYPAKSPSQLSLRQTVLSESSDRLVDRSL